VAFVQVTAAQLVSPLHVEQTRSWAVEQAVLS
jgi:hypothetical protein